ncbi:uncharacterized protein METZ01_LOCUS430024, partial [marine metagenome]
PTNGKMKNREEHGNGEQASLLAWTNASFGYA